MIPKENKNFSILSYLKNKFWRLYPSYFLAVSFIFFSVLFFHLPQREVTFFDYFLNLLFLNGFISTDYVDGAHWYLTYLILFYFLTAFLISFFLSRNYKQRNLFLILLLIFKDVFKVIAHFFPVFDFVYLLFGKDFLEFLILGYLLNFRVQRKEKNRFNLFLLVFCFIHIFLFKGLVVGFSTILFFWIFSFVLMNNKKISKHNFLLYNGKISFILYLIHQNIGYIILLKLFDSVGKFEWWFVFVTYLVLFCLSSFWYEIYEKRILGYIREKKCLKR